MPKPAASLRHSNCSAAVTLFVHLILEDPCRLWTFFSASRWRLRTSAPNKSAPSAGIPIFGLDALSSAAYGPEAALTLLIPLGAAGVAYIVPVSASIIVLLAIVYFSYRQTIAAYPGGGGSYTVASENLGTYPGLLAAAALMLDYVLTAAVGISAGVGALVSAVPQLQPHTLAIVPGHSGGRHDRESCAACGKRAFFS